MFQRLKDKWHLSWPRFILVFSTFALGGSLCGYLGRILMGLTGLEKNVLYYIIYIILVTLLWPFCVITISIPMGQFPFFRNYLRRMWGRIVKKGRESGVRSEGSENQLQTTDHQHRTTLAIFASGAGSNAQKLMEQFTNHPFIQVALVVCNKPGAGVTTIAARHQVPVLMIEKERFFRGGAYLEELQRQKIDFIVLAGFLWKVPEALVHAYPNKIINIHPALLPKYGGKGMYGMRVHEAVIAAGETQSGITIHYVNEHFDEGQPIFQASCPVTPQDTPESLAQKVHALEHRHFPEVVEQLLADV